MSGLRAIFCTLLLLGVAAEVDSDTASPSKGTVAPPWSDLTESAVSFIGRAPPILVDLVTLAFFGILAYQLLRKAVWKITERAGRYAYATVGRVVAPAGRESIADSVRARIADELDAAASPVGTMLDPSGGGADLPKMLELQPQIAFIGPLIAWLRQPPHLRISGALHERGGLWSASVEVTNSIGHVLDRIYIGPRGDLDELAKRIAAWSALEFQRHRFWKSSTTRHSTMGTSSWQSYAAVRCSRPREALIHDPRNTLAMLHVAMEETERFDDRAVMSRGIARLESALGELEELSKPLQIPFWPAEARRDPRWFQSKYLLTVAYLHRFALREEDPSSGEEAREDVEKGLDVAVELARALGATGKALRRWTTRQAIGDRDERSLRLMLEQDANFFVGVLAGAKASQEWFENPQSPRGEGHDHNDDAEWPSERDLWNGLASLDRENLPDAHRLANALSDDFLGAAARYNHACFHVRAREFQAALEDLKLSFENHGEADRPAYIEWAQKDPTLEPLRRAKREEFESVIASVTPPEMVGVAPTADEGWSVEVFGVARALSTPPSSSKG
ncbi:MAG: hypothetical protein GY937_08620 [bacterium]|nr:hypothetical protein [bacterium]